MLNVAQELAILRKMPTSELRAKYAELFGETTQSLNRIWLVKRVIWRMQALSEGDLSERARQRAMELANDADIRRRPPKVLASLVDRESWTKTVKMPTRSPRLPPPGSVITRVYKGLSLQVLVTSDGFEFEGERFKTISAVAKKITGSHCNGFLFFRLDKEAD